MRKQTRIIKKSTLIKQIPKSDQTPTRQLLIQNPTTHKPTKHVQKQIVAQKPVKKTIRRQLKVSPSQLKALPTQMDNIVFRPDFPMIITGYTTSCHLGDYYKRAVTRLVKSCIKFDLQYMVFPLKPVDDWITGCALKPTIILHALQTLNKPILWIDADAEIFKFPDLMLELKNFDMALHSQNGHWLTGTLYFKPTAIDFVKEWKQCTHPPEADEITLLRLFSNHKKPPKLYGLPPTYNEVVYESVDTTKLVIGHYMRPDVAATRGVTPIALPD